MSSSLTDEQSAAVRQWAEEGADLSAIQQRLDEEFDVRLTFMDTRFLISDLGIELEEEADPEPEPEPAAETESQEPVPQGAEPVETEVLDDPAEAFEQPAESAVADENSPEADGDAATATATVTISDVQRPGVMISGRVTFDGGEQAEWYLDQMGQLGMNPDTAEFRPSPAQMRAFQLELQKAAQQQGI